MDEAVSWRDRKVDLTGIEARSSVSNVSERSTTVDREAALERYRRHVNLGFARLAALTNLPVEVSSEGSVVVDERGQQYLDCGGYGVFILGHRHPAVTEAVKAQLDCHPLTTRLLINAELASAAEILAGVTPAGLDYVQFTNSGAEAVEVGVKIARLNGKHKLIAMQGGYHGKTMGALSITGRPHYQQPFRPLLPDVRFIPFGDMVALEDSLVELGSQSCVILEPVQAEGGVIFPAEGYLREVKDACTRHDALLILDEIQTGLGRLGAWWGADREEIVPDVLLVGKGLSGGVVPVAAAVATGAAFDALNRDPLLHSSTFAGNPLAMAAAQAAIGALQHQELPERANKLGRELLQSLRAILSAKCPELISEVRGVGLLIGIELKAAHVAGDFMFGLLRRNIVVSNSLNSQCVVRLTPPAILTKAECAWLLAAVEEVSIELSRRYG